MKKILLLIFGIFVLNLKFSFTAYGESWSYVQGDKRCMISTNNYCTWCGSSAEDFCKNPDNCSAGYNEMQINGILEGTDKNYRCTSDGFSLICSTTETNELRDETYGYIYIQNRCGDDCLSWCTSGIKGCIPGFYLIQASSQRRCYKCPDGSTSNSDSTTPVISVWDICVAKEGYYLETKNGTTTVKACPANATCPGGKETFSCNKGFYKNNSQDGCTSCPTGSTTESVGSGSILDCTAIEGYYGNSGVFNKCPDNSTSPAGSTSINQCICNKGAYKSGTDCILCPSINGIAGTTNTTGATDVSQCYIAKGTSIEDSTGFFRFSNNCNHQKN